MLLEDVYTLDCTVNPVCELETGLHLCHSIIVRTFPKTSLRPSVPSKTNQKVLQDHRLGFRHTEENVLNHGHDIEASLHWDEVAFILEIDGENKCAVHLSARAADYDSCTSM